MNTLTMLVAIVIKKGFLIPEFWKKVVPSMNLNQYECRYTTTKELRLTVEDEVDTSELLPCLDEDTGQGTESNLVVAGLEAIEVRRLAELLLLLEVGADLVQLGLNLRVGGWKTGEAGH